MSKLLRSDSRISAASTPKAPRALLALLVGLVAGCGGTDGPGPGDLGVDATIVDAGHDAGPDAGHDAGQDAGRDAGPVVPCQNLPGLYQAGSCTALAAGVMPYEPQFELWSDGAVKDRFILLPSGTTIDATDPDAWIYPVGTTLWKHFTVGGLRVETRMLKKVSSGIGLGAWEMRTFQWNDTEDDVVEVLNGAQNVRGTPHDIPAQVLCQECHRTKDVVNGFSAIQLNHGAAGVPLTYLLANNVLANLPLGFTAASATLPNATPTETAALGYLHANCGHCHLGVGGVIERASQRFWIPTRLTDVSMAPVYGGSPYGSVGVATLGWMTGTSMKRVDPHALATSAVHQRMNTRVVTNQMPPLATEAIDTAGLATIDAWINSLP